MSQNLSLGVRENVRMKNHPNVKCEKSVSRSVSGSGRMKDHANVNCDHSEGGSVGSNMNMTRTSVHEAWENC